MYVWNLLSLRACLVVLLLGTFGLAVQSFDLLYFGIKVMHSSVRYTLNTIPPPAPCTVTKIVLEKSWIYLSSEFLISILSFLVSHFPSYETSYETSLFMTLYQNRYLHTFGHTVILSFTFFFLLGWKTYEFSMKLWMNDTIILKYKFGLRFGQKT